MTIRYLGVIVFVGEKTVDWNTFFFMCCKYLLLRIPEWSPIRELATPVRTLRAFPQLNL